jgi:nucleoside-diphosphate-sugar epimerase
MNKVLHEDVLEFVKSFSLAEEFRNSIFLITGSSGLVGSSLIHCLLALQVGVRIVAPVRSIEKARQKFDQQELEYISLIECDLAKFDYDSLDAVDYIIHCAAPTSSKFFVEHPVETFASIYDVTKVLLDFASRKKVKGFVYLSSLEVYGEINDDSCLVTEDAQGYLDPLSVRSSYPMAKRATENLCCLYASQYSVPVKISRLTQTTGAGIAKDDNRVIAQFARLAANGQNIVLHTTGESARPYCYTMDSVSGILFVLLRGKSGEAYNVANDDTYISARDMAAFVRDNINSSIKVIVELNDNMGYAPVSKLKLSSLKLRGLGWCAKYGLKEIFERLDFYFKS